MADESTVTLSDSQEILIDFGDICRFCLNETDSTISINDKYVTEGKKEERTIYDFVTGFSNIEVEYPNGFPTSVCTNCWEMIQICHEFLESCRQSDASLRDCYNTTLEQTKAQFFPDVKGEIENEESQLPHDAKQISQPSKNTLSDRLKEAQLKLKEDIMRSQYIMSNLSKEHEGKTCGTCFMNFFTEESLKIHIESKHKIITKCKFCPEMFLEGPSLTNHYKNNHQKAQEETSGDKKFYCLSCEPAKSFTRRDSVQRHLKMVHGKSWNEIQNETVDEENAPHELPQCNVAFAAKRALNNHSGKHHLMEPKEIKKEPEPKPVPDPEPKLSKVYVCMDCYPPNTFQDVNEFLTHKNITHGKDMENISLKELAPIYVPSVNVFGLEDTKFNVICKNCDPPVTFSTAKDFLNHVNGYHEFEDWNKEVVEFSEQETKPEVKEKFKCPDCTVTFGRKYNLRRHMKIIHGKNVKIGYTRCPDCEQYFLTNRKVVQHGLTVHQKYYADLHNQYKEKILEKTRKSERDKKFECDHCGRKYQLKDALRKHMQKDHLNKLPPEENVSCPYCKKTLTNKTNLKSHIEYVHEALFVSCPVCQKKVNFKAIGKHYKTHQNSNLSPKPGKFLCNLCGKVLQSKRSFEDHQKIHDNIRDHVCDVCGEGFTNRRCLNTHKRIHQGPLRKVFKCESCDKTFNGRQSLNRHMLTHSGTKDFVCEVCSKTFYTIQELKRHLRYHKKDYRFQCQLCDMKFFDKSRYRTHLMRHRNIRPHKCDFCDKVFIVRRKMHLHMAARHNYQVSDTRGIWKDPKTYVPLDELL